MTKHTPGPWKAEVWYVGEKKEPQTVIVSEHDAVARAMDLWVPDGRIAERDANANLIAAAPNMLAALQALCSACTSPHPDVGGTCAPDIAYLEAARAAIAKAKGGAA